MPERKIVLFGGTFDPIHLGHTAVAAAAGEHIGADKVVFVPARRSPLKAFFSELKTSQKGPRYFRSGDQSVMATPPR